MGFTAESKEALKMLQTHGLFDSVGTGVTCGSQSLAAQVFLLEPVSFCLLVSWDIPTRSEICLYHFSAGLIHTEMNK